MLRRAFVLLALAGLAGCSPGSTALDRLARGESGKVVEIRAGDAFILDSGQVVRLAGVELPHHDEPGAAEARTALSNLVLGQQVTLLYGGARRDRYDRAIAQVRVSGSGKWVQKALLDDGRVRVHTWPDDQALAKPMLTAEAGARQAGRGLWALPAYRVLLPSETPGGPPGFVVMEGKVARATHAGGGLWLDFTEGGSSVLIPGTALRDLRKANQEPETWAGRVIRVRGWLSGGTLKADHVAAFEQVSMPKAPK